MGFIFKIVFIIILGINIWFSSDAIYDLWIYSCLDRQAPSIEQKWSIKEISSSEYALKSSYRFQVKGKLWKGKFIFEKPHHLNKIAADKALIEKKRAFTTIWYSSSNPKINSLEKQFPYKKCFHSLMALGVLAYFFIFWKHFQELLESKSDTTA